MRILFAYRDDIDVGGGAATVMEHTATALRALGAEVEIGYEAEPDVDGFDIVHAWNIWHPPTALAQLRYLRTTGVPVVWQPFYLHWTEATWAGAAVRGVFAPERPEHERAQLLAALRDGTIAVNNWQRHLPNEVFPGFHAHLREMLDLVDHVCACSSREMQMLMQVTGATSKPWTLARHGVDAATFRAADAEPFVERFGLRDFVLSVGSVDGRKNQLMLIEALRGTGQPLVLIGPCYEPDYLELCRSRMDDGMLWLDRLPRELVASAYQAASVHVLPSFAEGSALASMEAAASGCPVVVGNRSSEFEYYGDLAGYCDPVDPASIRQAIGEARTRGADPAYGRALVELMERHTWESAARATLAAYDRVGAQRATALRASLGLGETRSTAVLAFAQEIVDNPDLLRRYASAVSGADDVTLVVGLPDVPGELEARLVEAAESAGIDGPSSADVLAVALPEPLPTALRESVDAVLSARDLPASLRGLPCVSGDEPALRALIAGRG